eukprot:COSAG01_NODE_3343_length_6226_cov_7.362272_4_plen_208_part_00
MRLAHSAFSVRWTGTVTADTSVNGAVVSIFAKSAYGGKAFNGARLALGSSVKAGKWDIDAWNPERAGVSYQTTYNFKAGVPVPLVMEYRKPDGNGNVELQWSLIGNASTSLADAVSAAATADATIVAVGGSDQTTNEGCDRAELNLPGSQLQFLQAVHAVAKKLVVVLIGGRPVAEPWIKDHCAAVIASMCGGQAQGTALANIISGK